MRNQDLQRQIQKLVMEYSLEDILLALAKTHKFSVLDSIYELRECLDSLEDGEEGS